MDPSNSTSTHAYQDLLMRLESLEKSTKQQDTEGPKAEEVRGTGTTVQRQQPSEQSMHTQKSMHTNASNDNNKDKSGDGGCLLM